MAGIVDLEQLRELAGFRSEKGCAVSVYVNLDPSEAPTPAAVETRVDSGLDHAGRLFDERKGTMSHDAREAMKADLLRIRAWFDDDFERDRARGVAVFAAGLDNFWSTLTTADPVSDGVSIAADLYLKPLAPLVDRPDAVLVAAVSRERGTVYRLQGGQLLEIADETASVPGRHDQGGWSQARYERHTEEIVERHWRRVADTLDTHVRQAEGAWVVLVGVEDMRSEFDDVLSNEVKTRLIGWATAEAHAHAAELLEAVQPVLDEWYGRRESELLDRWREAAGRNGHATAGWEQTLEAASDGRVELLLVQDGADRPAYQCPLCGRAQANDGNCPLDGTPLERRESGLDVALHKTFAYGGSVHVVRDRQDLAPVGGIGALLRF